MKKEFDEFYKKYKKQILPVGLFCLAIFIIFRVILPQLTSIGDSNQIISQKTSEAETLQNTLSILTNSNADEVSSDQKLVMQALPNSKDITLIFSALSSAAAASNVELKEFSLKIGGLYGRAANIATGGVKGVPAVDVIARVEAPDGESMVLFSNELQKRLPLSEIKKIDASSNLGTFDISFYYKTSDLALLSKQDKLTPLNQADLNLLNQLRENSK